MNIVIATPLYPPDIAPPAPYIKELATRLKEKHEITIVTYGRLPELVSGVQIITIDKHLPRFVRVMGFTRKLHRHLSKETILFIENGPSVEFPTAIISLLRNIKLIVHYGDERALEHEKQHPFLHLVGGFVRKKAIATISSSPSEKPEILPFDEKPVEALNAYERSWAEHIANLETKFVYEK